MTFYTFARALVLSFCSLAFRVRVVGRERVPASGAFIVAPTHRSGFDIPFTAYITKRQVCFLAKEELFANRFLAWLFGALGAIRVERGTADRAALRVLEERLRAGGIVAVYPEGTRGSGPELGPLFDGAAYLAVKVGVPIVPVGIGGSEQILSKGRKLPRSGRVAVVVGDVVPAPAPDGERRRAAASRMTAALRVELQQCFSAAQELAGS